MKCVATTTFGLEAVCKRELDALGYNILSSDNGKIYFEANIEGLIYANLYLRTADRVYIVVGEQKVMSFDDLFEFVKGMNLKQYLDSDGQFIIDAKSVKSKVYSLRDIQSITKKALIENLKVAFKQEYFKETNAKFRFIMQIQKDQAEFWLDTSGEALHKRGYRIDQGEAPIKETLAAGLVLLSFYEPSRTLYDPFCGAGTIAIEAAMIARNIAPGLNRKFAFESFGFIDRNVVKKVRKEAFLAIDQDSEVHIEASDMDPNMIEMAKENAIEAGVDEDIHFEMAKFEHKVFDAPYGIIITNPPYGERLEDKDKAMTLYHEIGTKMNTLSDYSVYIITSLGGVEKILKRNAERTRVLYNGNIKSRYYQFLGPRPKAQ